MTYIQGTNKRINKRATCTRCQQPGHEEKFCPVPGLPEKKLQVTFEMTNPHAWMPKTVGGHIQHMIEKQLDASIDRLSVREGLPIGARELPTGQLEPLSARLQFILDFLDDEDERDGRSDLLDSAAKELNELLADVKKAEGV